MTWRNRRTAAEERLGIERQRQGLVGSGAPRGLLGSGRADDHDRRLRELRIGLEDPAEVEAGHGRDAGLDDDHLRTFPPRDVESLACRLTP